MLLPANSFPVPIKLPARSQRATGEPFPQTSPNPIATDTTTWETCNAVGAAVVTIYTKREIGSGCIVSSNGRVITSCHVVQDALHDKSREHLLISTAGGHRYSGRVIAIDMLRDLALIQLDAPKRMPAISIARSKQGKRGDLVCAIGSPFGHPGILTWGKLDRVRTNGDLQSKILLHPGNSGGPLLNQRGEMIGVNRAILQSSAGENIGISFATPIRTVINFLTTA
jgi:serine protease Do